MLLTISSSITLTRILSPEDYQSSNKTDPGIRKS